MKKKHPTRKPSAETALTHAAQIYPQRQYIERRKVPY